MTSSNFGAHVRDSYRLDFAHQVAAGRIKPLILPYAVLGSFLLPVLYFTAPHVHRPWLYAARWPLMAFIFVFNLHETFTTSSANFAIGYAVGLMQAWGIVWAATLLIWMRPQFEAERVEKRKRKRTKTTSAGVSASASSVARQQSGPFDDDKAPDEDVATSLGEGYEYYWQAYPADAPWTTRLGWSVDLVLSFRGTGWNWCVPVVPHFAKPEKPLSGALVDLASIPLVTRQGYRRYRTSGEWLRSQVHVLLLGYLVLDLLSVLMMKDPYFILGPELAATAAAAAQPLLELPPFLAALPPVLLALFHSLSCFAAIAVVIHLIMTSWQLVAHLLLPPALVTGRTRAELWHYPSVNGSFVHNVLDRGVAGFWGGWWHQTFRVAFGAPGAWLARRGWLDLRTPRGKAIAGLLAFAQSGFLHAMGSVTCLPPSKPWLPVLFFLLCWAGIFVQAALSALLGHVLLPLVLPLLPADGGDDDSGSSSSSSANNNNNKRPPSSTWPTWLRRTGHFFFCFVYLNACQFLLCDDLARSAIWLLEPVPVSPLRALGLGKPGDSWWRWGDPALWPRWYYGGPSRWWETGIAL